MGKTFSPLLNMAAFGVQLHWLQTRALLRCHELCLQLMAENQASGMHGDAQISNFLPIHGDKQRCDSTHLRHIFGLMCTQPNPWDVIIPCAAEQRKG